MRPRSLAEIVGQQKLLAEGHILRCLIEHDRLGSLILWGPPGSGKTTVAEVIALQTRARFIRLSATSDGVGELRRIIDAAQHYQHSTALLTIVFIDEIHRFTKVQQDVLLPHIEHGTITLIGATTENPSFTLTSALLSRCRVVQLEPLSGADIRLIISRALADEERGLGKAHLTVSLEALDFLIQTANGDARVALNVLEAAADIVQATSANSVIERAIIEQIVQHQALHYDRSGDWHYQLISAFIKSVRGSDPDAAIYWLARMLEAGEDPLFISRRMILLASEDIGLADPFALVLATQTHTAIAAIGMPEGYLPLAETTVYLALAPKSNSTLTAYQAAAKIVNETFNLPVPLHLRNASTAFDRAIGVGHGYLYPHDSPAGFVFQEYLPKEIKTCRFYTPGHNHFEEQRYKELLERQEQTPSATENTKDNQSKK